MAVLEADHPCQPRELGVVGCGRGGRVVCRTSKMRPCSRGTDRPVPSWNASELPERLCNDASVKLLGRSGGLLGPLIGVVAGFVIGWGVGSWTACAPGPGCEVRVNAIGALGTWVGGLGTVGALIYGVRTFRDDAAERKRAITLDSRRSAVRYKPMAPIRSGTYTKVNIAVTNQGAVDMTDVSLVLDRGTDAETVLGSADQVHSGRLFGVTKSVEELGLQELPTEPQQAANKVVKAELAPRVSLVFSVGGERFVRVGSDVQSI